MPDRAPRAPTLVKPITRMQAGGMQERIVQQCSRPSFLAERPWTTQGQVLPCQGNQIVASVATALRGQTAQLRQGGRGRKSRGCGCAGDRRRGRRAAAGP
eukprot:6202375-Pleurochrysis_carterae.AAC.1